MAKRISHDTSAEGDMTPMIDMTFQLIAFFMVLINFSEEQQDQRINLPSSELAKPPEGALDTPLTLQMTNDAKVLFNTEYVSVENMAKFLDIEVSLLKRTNKSPQQANVIIRADGSVPTGQVQKLIKLCQDKQFEKFALRAKQAEKK